MKINVRTLSVLVFVVCVLPLAIMPISFTCTCATDNDGIGGDWNPWGIGISDNEILFSDWNIANFSFDIYKIDTDGSNRVNLTNHEGIDSSPLWSPDGTKIAFISDRDGNRDIYAMNADGTDQINLTDNTKIHYNFKWSPDGSYIAFVSEKVAGQSYLEEHGIYLMNMDDSQQTLLANTWGVPNLVWSPDGSQISYHSFSLDDNKITASDIYVIRIDATDLTNLTHDSDSIDLDPVWSPDGTKIAFTSKSDSNLDIYVMASDGSNRNRLTDAQTDVFAPTWSPDGTKIAFMSERNGNYDIYVMNADGSHQARIADDAGPYPLSWSINSGKVFYISNSEVTNGGVIVYSINADGTGKTILAN